MQADPRAVLEKAQTVAVVGCSSRPHKAAHRIPAWLHDAGFTVLPVNPNADEILGRTAVDSLADLDEPPDLVVVFRPSPETPEVARQAVAVGAEALWLQSGIHHDEAEAIADEAGIAFVSDRCSGVDAQTFGITKNAA